MRRPPAPESVILALILVILTGIALMPFAWAGRGAAGRWPAVTPDSSAVVVLAENRSSVPTEIFFKRDSVYDRLGVCPPSSRCLYVIPSARLGALADFQLAGLAHGEASPTDSPKYHRIPGTVNVPMYVLSPGEAPAAREGRATRRVY